MAEELRTTAFHAWGLGALDSRGMTDTQGEGEQVTRPVKGKTSLHPVS